MKRTFGAFLIMILLAFFFGASFFFFDEFQFPFHSKNKEIIFTIPQTDVEEEVNYVQAILLFNASDYFVYKGFPIGFQYEMLRELEKGLGRNIHIKVEAKASMIMKDLFENNYDLVAMDINHSAFLLPMFEASIPHSFSYPVLLSGIQADTLDNHTIWVSNDFSAMHFFKDESIYSNYPVQRQNEFSTEELIERVDTHEIPYMICGYNEAITLLPFYSNVQIVSKAGPQFDRRWILNKKNMQLNEDINHWLLDFKKTPKYRRLIRKYFSQESSLINDSFANRQQGSISKYDAIIQKYAQMYDFDWRFIASIICQETKFISGLIGKGGSVGLMQLMPVTMEYYGVTEADGDEGNIRAGVQHLNLIRNSFDEIVNDVEKLYFVAAAYNAGRGHLFDAQRLCTKFDADFLKWKDVSKYLKLKSQHQYATDSVVKSGYYPGTSAVKYAHHVMERYSAYLAAYPE